MARISKHEKSLRVKETKSLLVKGMKRKQIINLFKLKYGLSSSSIDKYIHEAKKYSGKYQKNDGELHSISYSSKETIEKIMKIHLEGSQFEADVCFNEGRMYGSLPKPRLKFDILPRTPDTIKSCYSNLPLSNGKLTSIIADPPFLIGNPKTKIEMLSKYSNFKNLNEFTFSYQSLICQFNKLDHAVSEVFYFCSNVHKITSNILILCYRAISIRIVICFYFINFEPIT